jgi:peptidyl-dipeptidase Dcp
MSHPIFESQLFDSAIDFTKVKSEDLAKEVKSAFDKALKERDQLIQPTKEITWENTMAAMENCGQNLEQVMSLVYNFFSSMTDDNVQILVEEYSTILTEYSNSMTLNKNLFERVKYIYDNQSKFNLDSEQKELLKKSYESFVRNGALLSDAKKEELMKIDNQLSEVSPQYSKNLLQATKSFYMEVEAKDLEGLPESSREQAKVDAEEKGLKGKFIVTLDMPSFMPFMQYSKNRTLREKLYKANVNKTYKDQFDNQENVRQMVKLRDQKAKILGFKNYASFILQNRMAETEERVFSFLNQLKNAAFPVAVKEVKEISDYAKSKDGITDFKPWDFAYYSESLKKEKYDFDSELLRPYFKLENVLQGAFDHAFKLYGLKFKIRTDLPKYHPDVTVYEVTEDKTNEYIGLFYADFFPRDSKRGGAWMTSFREQGEWYNQIKRPHISIVCNFTKPTPTKPSLLNFMEVQTLFHEFGHSLHGLLSKCKYRSLSGTNVLWDFVELPSQIMENWTLEKEGLNIFAKHYETGAAIPEEYIQKLQRSENFLKAYGSIRQYNFAYLDMIWHTHPNTEFKDIHDYEKEVLKDSLLFDHYGSSSCSFSHIFAGGYAAGYYSYKWAEVLDADAFEFFKEKGIFNTDVADAFKNFILSKGSTEHPMELYKKFRGREPDINALLRRDNLI